MNTLLDQLDQALFCEVCNENVLNCFCWILPNEEEFLDQPDWQAPQATILASEGNRNEAPPPQLQEMESNSGAGALAVSAAPEFPYTDPIEHAWMTPSPREANLHDTTMAALAQPSFETPDLSRHINHLQASNVRESVEEQPDVSGPDSATRIAANILAHGPVNGRDGEHMLGFDYLTGHVSPDALTENQRMVSQLETDFLPGDPFANGGSEELLLNSNTEPQKQQAFAKLVFGDGDFYVRTYDVMLGRNQDVFKRVKQQKKAQRVARDTLHSYRQEPSQPSQPDDGDQQGLPSTSSQSLEGRPAPPANVSEPGGIVSYQAYSDGELERQRPRRRKRHSLQFSKSSSTTSIAPASLHPSMMQDVMHTGLFTADGEPQIRTYAFIPVHPKNPEDITKISKEHLMFSYNFAEEKWELEVVGNRALVNEKLFNKGDIVPLDHNDEIMVSSLHITFKLPDNFRHSPGLSRGTFSRNSDEESLELSEDEDRAVSTSPARRLSNAMEADDSDEEDDDEVTEGTARPKLKLNVKNKTKGTKLKLKKDQAKSKALEKSSNKRPKKESPMEKSPDATKKTEKGKKPQAAAKVPAEPGKTEKTSSPTAPPQFDPNSALANVPVEELPQKRKGPGRPPKNGLVSKRDQAMVLKKQKEYEKRGEQAPTYDNLVQMVRQENKNKEAAAKAIANGQPPPDMSVMPSIETEHSPNAVNPMAGPSTGDGAQVSAASAEPVRKSSPKPKRHVRTPSPFPPQSAYTEEELKRPQLTYIHILDQVLREHPTGGADLQEIYDRIQKRFPYYRYGVTTKGWESSVRHNLLGNHRFEPIGKSGKGQLWKINYNVPLDREKKRKVTPPIRQPVQNGQYTQPPQQHYGQQQYGNPYAQSQANGQQQGSGTYYSPYAQQAQNQAYGGHGQAGGHPNQAVAYPARHSQPAPPQSSMQRPSAQPPVQRPNNTPFQNLVNDIMDYRTRWIAQFVESVVFDDKQHLFQQMTQHATEVCTEGKDPAGMPPLETEEQKQVYADLCALCEGRGFFGNSRLSLSNGHEMPTGNVESAVNQAVEDERTALNGIGHTNGSVPSGQINVGAPKTPNQPDDSVPTSAHPAPSANGQDLLATSQGVDVPPRAEAEQRPVIASPSGTKRPAEDDGESIESKRAKQGWEMSQ